MNREEQTLELKSTTEEKNKLDSIGRAENVSEDEGLRLSQKYKTVFNCSYSELQE